jgi:hypothetical protein
MVVSGDVDRFAADDFGAGRPAWLVVGNGGDAADVVVQPAGPGLSIDGLAVQDALQDARHGCLVLDRSPTGWHGIVHGADDAVLAHCWLSARSLSCR